MIVVACGDHIIALVILFFHIVEEHRHLLCLQVAVGAVSGKVQIEHHQFLAAFHLCAGYGITAIEVKYLRKAFGNGKASSDGIRYLKVRQRQDTGIHKTVRLQRRHRQERRMSVSGEYAVIAVKAVVEHLTLIDVVASG